MNGNAREILRLVRDALRHGLEYRGHDMRDKLQGVAADILTELVATEEPDAGDVERVERRLEEAGRIGPPRGYFLLRCEEDDR